MKYTYLAIIIFVLSACGKVSIPRPYGYFRVDLPENSYTLYQNESLPYTVDISKYACVKMHEAFAERDWIDIFYPHLNATVYCSYFPMKNKSKLYDLSEESRKFVYQHTVKADGISEKAFKNPEKNVYGILYQIDGNSASSVQFILTDSVKNFLRGALYFNNVPNKDSIAPMNDYVKRDIVRLMESLEWKN